jgi:hypothetical protein
MTAAGSRPRRPFLPRAPAAPGVSFRRPSVTGEAVSGPGVSPFWLLAPPRTVCEGWRPDLAPSSQPGQGRVGPWNPPPAIRRTEKSCPAHFGNQQQRRSRGAGGAPRAIRQCATAVVTGTAASEGEAAVSSSRGEIASASTGDRGSAGTIARHSAALSTNAPHRSEPTRHRCLSSVSPGRAARRHHGLSASRPRLSAYRPNPSGWGGEVAAASVAPPYRQYGRMIESHVSQRPVLTAHAVRIVTTAGAACSTFLATSSRAQAPPTASLFNAFLALPGDTAEYTNRNARYMFWSVVVLAASRWSPPY